MVEDQITDGKRIAQLLASELTGLAAGRLARVSVVDADPDAGPSDGGTFAYGIAVDGERVADVYVHEERTRIELERVADPSVKDGNPNVGDGDLKVDDGDPHADDADPSTDTLDGGGLSVTATNDGYRVVVERGAAVKRAVDHLVAVVVTD